MYNVLGKLRAGRAAAAGALPPLTESTGRAVGPPSPLAGEGGASAPGEGSGRVARDPSSAPGSSPGAPSPSRGEGRSARKVASVTNLTPRQEDIKSRGLILILKELHDELDAAVFRAYGWPEDLSDEQILERLVALNQERAEEEARGQVRWLRPDYQIPRFGTATQKAQKGGLELVAPEEKGKPSFPSDERRRTSAIYAVLAGATAPLGAAEIAARFKQGRRVERDIALTLRAYVRFGDVMTPDGGKSFVLKRVA